MPQVAITFVPKHGEWFWRGKVKDLFAICQTNRSFFESKDIQFSWRYLHWTTLNKTTSSTIGGFSSGVLHCQKPLRATDLHKVKSLPADRQRLSTVQVENISDYCCLIAGNCWPQQILFYWQKHKERPEGITRPYRRMARDKIFTIQS